MIPSRFHPHFVRWLFLLCMGMAFAGCQQWDLATKALEDRPPPAAEAFASPNPVVRKEALRWWSEAVEGDTLPPLPAEAMSLQRDPDPRVRGEFALALGRGVDPAAVETLLAMLADQDLQVRLAVLDALGRVPAQPNQEDNIREVLATRLKEDLGYGEKIRATAAMALARRHCWNEVAAAANDRSFRVRLALAEQLSEREYPLQTSSSAEQPASEIDDDSEAVRDNLDSADAIVANEAQRKLAAQLIGDSHPAVQQAAVAAISAWPLAEAAPLWLSVLNHDVFQTRAAAYKRLSARWPAAKGFPFDARFAPERTLRWQELNAQWELTAAQLAAAESSASPKAIQTVSHQRRVASSVPPATVDKLRRLLRSMQQPGADAADQREWKLQLANVGPDLLPALEQLHESEPHLLGEFLFREVLPEQSPAYRALDELASGSVETRRRAARSLETLVKTQPLTPLAAARLATLAEAEQDALVWHSLLQVASTPSGGQRPDLPDRFWQLALEQPHSGVRRWACELVGQLNRPQLAAALAPLAHVEDATVSRAAAKALSNLGPGATPETLESLLAANDHATRVAAAASLCKAGMHSGAAALSRLSYDSDPAIRQQVAEAIGELGDRQHLSILMRFLDDARNVQRAALLALPKVVGVDESLRAPSSNGAPPTTTEQIATWKAWYERENRTQLRIIPPSE